MNDTLAASLQGLQLVMSWPNIIWPVAGTLLSMLVSLLPGISGVALMSVVIPLTISMEPVQVMLLFGALVGGSTFAGSLTAILFNIPGRNSNTATTFDGYPLTQRGKAKTAIGCAAAASALGSTLGIVMLVTLLPFLSAIAISFGPAELLMIMIWGIFAIVLATRGSRLKGFAIAGVGVLFSFVGSDPRTAEPRFTFGFDHLLDGINLVVIFIGLFAIAESIELLQRSQSTLSGVRHKSLLSGSTFDGIKSLFKHFGTFLRSAFTGALIGVIPGVGGTVASFIAYGNESRLHPNTFGKGDIRGVIAPESANDAKDGGALVPTLALGIPGGMGTAMLLAALNLHGITPGTALIQTNLTLVFVLIWSLFISNWLTSIVGIGVAAPLSRLTVLPVRRIAPVILVFATMAVFLYRGSYIDVFIAYGFGFFGYAMKRLDWPRIPFVIALVLTPECERYLQITVRLHALGKIDFWSRPIVIGLGLFFLLIILAPLNRFLLTRFFAIRSKK